MGFYSLDDSEKTKSSKDEDVIGYITTLIQPTQKAARLISPFTALTSSSALSRRAGRARTRHLTRLRSPDGNRQSLLPSNVLAGQRRD